MKGGLNERRFTAIAAIVVVLSTAWFGYHGMIGQQEDGEGATWREETDYQGVSNEVSRPQIAVPWSAPRPMARGDQWLYDLFSPPEVFYDAQSGQFRTTAPSRAPDISVLGESADEVMPGLILHTVEREPFPLQLIGFVGEPGNFLGTFENRVTHETLLLREGSAVDSLQMKVREFRIEQVARQIPDSMTVRENQAWAVIVDERTQTETVLRQGERAYTDGKIARVSLPHGDGESFPVVEGELIDSGSDQFRIEKIRLAPPEVDVTKEKQPDGVSEPFTLRPQANEDYPDDEE